MATRKDSLAETARDLNSAAIHLLRGMRAADRASGLTPARLSALSVLVFGGPSTLGQLARTEDVSGPTMTRIVDGLVTLGLATREEHPESARQVLISPTQAGVDLMQAAAGRRVDVIVAALAALPTGDRRAIVAAAPSLRELSARVPAVARDLARRDAPDPPAG
jgi:DNA-binding MarR family transcriptional regulator